MADPLLSSLADPAAAQRLGKVQTPNVSGVNTRAKAAEVAQEFEAMFIQEMLAPVFNQIETDGPFGGRQAEAAFRPMLLEEYARNIAEAGGIGIADSVMTEILRMQGLE